MHEDFVVQYFNLKRVTKILISPILKYFKLLLKMFYFQVFPNYHIYHPAAPHVAYMQPKANAPSFFMADELRQVR